MGENLSDAIRAQADLLEVVSETVNLKPAGHDDHVGICPFHEEKTASFHVHPKAGYYKCFGCAAKGSVIDFVMFTRHIEAKEAMTILADRYNVKAPANGTGRLPKPEPPAAGLRSPAELAAEYGLRWEDFEEARCIAEKGYIRYVLMASDGKPLYKLKSLTRAENGKRDDNKIIVPKGDDKARGKLDAWFGDLTACLGVSIVIAGGEEKKIAANVCGYIAVSFKGGEGSLTKTFAETVVAAGPSKVIICMDAGEKGAERFAKLLYDAGQRDIRIVQWPSYAFEGYDINNVMVDSGALEAKHLLDTALAWTPQANTEEKDYWPAPEPLENSVLLSPLLPEHFILIPELADMLHHTAESHQIDSTMAAPIILSVLSTALQGKVTVELTPSHTEPSVSQYFAVSSESGTRKSAVIKTLTTPVHDYEEKINAVTRQERAKIATEYKLLEGKIKKLEKIIERGEASQELMDEHARLVLALEDHPSSDLIQFLYDDVTLELLGDKLSKNNRGAFLSPEPGIFASLTGRYGNNRPDIGLLLKGYDAETCKVQRLSRADSVIKSPHLTVGIMVQPAELLRLINDPIHRQRGLSARFAVLRPYDTRGKRNVISPGIPPDTYLAYSQCVKNLLAWEPTPPILLKQDHEAWSVFSEFLQSIETKFLPGGEYRDGIADWASKLAGRTIRIAALLHCAQNHGDLRQLSTRIDKETVEAAIAISGVLSQHMGSVTVESQPSCAETLAKKVASWIATTHPRTFTRRDLYRRLHINSDTVQDLDKAITHLENLSWIRPENAPKYSPRGGRPASEAYLTNPKFHLSQTVTKACDRT